MTTIDAIRAALSQALQPSLLEIQDRSAQHASHAGAKERGGGHYDIQIVSPDFVGQSLLARHRMVYSALASLMKTGIHALAIQARAPDE